jgi:DNA-binding HxlR family transcriptional regulator
MAGNRSYGDQCGVARSLDVIGERWALLIVRELLLGPKRFNDLLAGLPGASPNVISQRLRELAGSSVIRQRDLPPPARVRLYELTDWGRELEPVILHLGLWGDRAPLPHGAQAGLDSVLLAIQAALGPAPLTGRYELRIGADTFTVDATAGPARFRRGTADQPEATVTTDADTFRAVVFGQLPIADAVASGDLRLAGDPDAAGRLTGLLLTLAAGGGRPLPAQAGSAS